jgi:hypothetical protein
MVDYDIYYDESKKDGHWHGIFFVPVDRREKLVSYLSQAREECPFKQRLYFKRIGNEENKGCLRLKLTESYISIGSASLQSQKFDKYPSMAKVGRTPKIINPIAAKLAIYRVSGEVMKACCKNQNLIITQTLKSALKGSLHYLFSEEEEISISRIFFEGESLQGIDDKKILRDLKRQVRDNIKFLPDRFLMQSSDHNKIEKGLDMNDSYILQLCDSMVGAARFFVVSNLKSSSRYNISLPIKEILSYSEESFSRMMQSRYFRGFCLSEAGVNGEDWEFSKLNVFGSKIESKQIKFI